MVMSQPTVLDVVDAVEVQEPGHSCVNQLLFALCDRLQEEDHRGLRAEVAQRLLSPRLHTWCTAVPPRTLLKHKAFGTVVRPWRTSCTPRSPNPPTAGANTSSPSIDCWSCITQAVRLCDRASDGLFPGAWSDTTRAAGTCVCVAGNTRSRRTDRHVVWLVPADRPPLRRGQSPAAAPRANVAGPAAASAGVSRQRSQGRHPALRTSRSCPWPWHPRNRAWRGGHPPQRAASFWRTSPASCARPHWTVPRGGGRGRRCRWCPPP